MNIQIINRLRVSALALIAATAHAVGIDTTNFTNADIRKIPTGRRGKWRGRGTPGAFGKCHYHITPISDDPRFNHALRRA